MANGRASLLRAHVRERSVLVRGRAVRSVAALALMSSVASTGFVALAVPAHAQQPAPTLVGTAPSSPGNNRTPQLSFQGGGTSYECSATAASSAQSWSACTSPWTVPTLTKDGDYTLAVREVTVTNDALQLTEDYVLDTTAQVTVSGPTSPGNDRTPTWNISVEQGGSATCTFDGTDVGDCSTGFTPATPLTTDGTHTLVVHAVDGLGNVASPVTSTYTLDTVAPNQPTVTGSSGTANTGSVSWSWANADGDTALCTLTSPSGTAAEAACTTGMTFTQAVTANGAYSLSVVLRDAAGNRSVAGTSPTYTLDTTPPPAPVIQDGPTGTSNTKQVTWDFTTPGASTSCQLSGTSAGLLAPFDCSTGTATVTLPSDDDWKLIVTTSDAYGNTATTTSADYLLDTTGPAAPTVSGPTGLSNNPNPQFTWTGELPSTAVCRTVLTTSDGTVTDGTWTACNARYFNPTLTTDGNYVVQVQLTDPVGNVGAIGTSAVYSFDDTPPAAPALTVPVSPGNDTTPTISFVPETNGSAQCTVYAGTVAPASPSWGNCTTSSTYTPTLTDGTWTLAVYLTDAAGNVGPASTWTYQLDTVGPTAVTITSPTSPSFVTDPTWQLVGDGNSTLSCQVLSGSGASASPLIAGSACTNAYTADLSSYGDGTYTFEVTATDEAGNTAVSTSVYVLDTTAPTAPVITGPTSPGNSASPTWSFTVQPQTTALCRLVQGIAMSAWSDCSNGTYTVTAPADGSYVVQVEVTDEAGNQAPIASSATYVSDRTAPAAPVVSGPSGPGNNPAPTWTWTGEDGTTATCRLDRAGVIGSPVPCNSGTFSPALTGDTSYVVVVQLTDAAGNVSPATTTSAYLLDTVAPANPVVSGPTGTANTATVTWTWTSETGSTSTCVLVVNGVAGTPATCTSGTPMTLPSDGSYVLQVQLTDAAGNSSAQVSSAPYVLDTTPPAAPVITTPSSPSNGLMPVFSFTSEPGSTNQCRYSRAGITIRDWSACTSPVTVDLTGLGDGSYVVEVRSTDAAQNQGPSSASLGYLLDTTPPAAPVVTAPASPSRNTTPTFTWTGEAGATASCRLVLGTVLQAQTACSSPYTPTLSGDGSWTLRVKLTDAADNTGTAGVSAAYVLDTTPPVTPVVTAPSSPGRNTMPSWSATVEAGSTQECRISNAAGIVVDWTSCTLPYVTDLSSRGDGTYTLSVRSTDAVGLVSAVGSASYTLDTTAPVAPTFTGTPASPGRSRTLGYTFTGEPGATLLCKLTSGSTVITSDTVCTSPLTVTLAAGAADGPYTLSVHAVDAAGNVGPSQSSNYVLDTTPPAAPVLVTGPAATGPNRTPSWTFTAEAGATVTCKVTGATSGFSVTATPCTSPYSVSLASSPDDTYTFTAKATDAAGNSSPLLTSTYILDSTAPTTADVTGPASPGRSTSPTWQVTSTEGTVQCRLVKSTTVVKDWASCGPTFTASLPASGGDGTYTLMARVVDAAGNLSPVVSSNYVLDTTAPAAATVTTPASPSNDRQPTFSVASTDPSVTAQCQVVGPGGAIGPFAPCDVSAAGSAYDLDLTSAADGSYTLDVRLTDPAGNTSPDARATYVLDTTAPNAVLVTAPPTPSSNATPSWSLTGDSDATLECRLTGPGLTSPAFGACSPTASVPGTGTYTADLTAKADGTYTLSVRSLDAAGNLGPETVSSYVLDRVPPAVPVLTTAAVSPSNVPTVTWTIGLDPGATALCTLSSATGVVQPEQACSTPLSINLSQYGDGAYVLSVVAIDAAGNRSAPVTSSYLLDTTPPEMPVITKAPGSPGNNPNPTWSVQTSESGGTLRCDLQGYDAGWRDCPAGLTYNLAPATSGTYQLEVSQVDAAGNTSPIAISAPYVFDTTAPAAPIVDPPTPSPGNSLKPVFKISHQTGDTDTVALSCSVTRFDGGASTASPCAFGDNTVDLSDVAPNSQGQVSLTVTATDPAGNVSMTTAVYLLDTAPPATPKIADLKDDNGLSPKVSWTFAGDKDADSYRCALTNKGAVPVMQHAAVCASPKDVTLSQYGPWTLWVAAVDQAGNFSTPAASTYQYLPPVPVVTGIKAEAGTTDSSPTWTFSVPRGYTAACLVSDAHGTALAAGDCTAGRFTTDVSGVGPGLYTLTVQLTDGHGNVGSYSGRSPYRYAPKAAATPFSGSPVVVSGGKSHPGTPPSTTPVVPSDPTPPSDLGGHHTSGDGGTTFPQQTSRSATSGQHSGLVVPSHQRPGSTTTSSHSGLSLPSVPSPHFLATGVPDVLSKTFGQAAAKPAIPLVVLAVVVGFLLLQNRIDRRDPKLASAPVGAEPELDFGPVQSLGPAGPTQGRSPGGPMTGGATA